jgi:phage terminase large subunit-like protein
LIAELSRFPASTHDDQVDAVALLAIVAATRGPPKKKKAAGPPASGSFWGT